MEVRWPDLHFCPINLWSAPWLGRKYESNMPVEVTNEWLAFIQSEKEVAIPEQSM